MHFNNYEFCTLRFYLSVFREWLPSALTMLNYVCRALGQPWHALANSAMVDTTMAVVHVYE